MDPCRNFAAGAKVLFAKYNGNPPDVVKSAYAADVMARISKQPAGIDARDVRLSPSPFTTPARTAGNLVYPMEK
jgi:hypothetical protein